VSGFDDDFSECAISSSTQAVEASLLLFCSRCALPESEVTYLETWRRFVAVYPDGIVSGAYSS